MLFDLKPKEKLRDLYNRREEYKELSRLTDSGSWVAVLGKRMTGKTSLIKTFANEKNGVYINLLGTRGIEGFATKLLTQTKFDLSEVGVKLIHAKWSKVAEEAFSKLSKRSVIILDEIQDVASPRLLEVLKSSWDAYHDLKIVFSGSYIGILRNLLEPDDASPMYGRTPARITLEPFSNQASRSFLLAGFKEHPSVRITDEQIGEATQKLSGYVGWLTYYGNFRCVRGFSHERAMSQTVTEASKILSSELDNFLRNRRKDLYGKVLRMCRNGARWSELMKELDINSKVLGDVLGVLKSIGLVEETSEGYYAIEDPILREAIKLL